MSRGKFIVGVDVGGTNIKFGLVASPAQIIARANLQTKNYIGHRDRLIYALAETIKNLAAKNHLSLKQIAGIGFGLPGLVNPLTGVIDFLPNIPGWKNVPLKKIIEQRLKIPVYLENDANMITLAEWQFGAGRGCRNLVCITLGTGVGGGLILDNKLYWGEAFAAGEIGHLPLNEKGPVCNCGGYGCFERYVGNQSLLAHARRIFKKSLCLEEIFALASQGDPRAVSFWEAAGEHIGNGLVGVINLLNPRRVVIGGGVSNNYKFLIAKINAVIQRRAMKVQAKTVKVVRAQLGDDAGLLGAAVLVNSIAPGKGSK